MTLSLVTAISNHLQCCTNDYSSYSPSIRMYSPCSRPTTFLIHLRSICWNNLPALIGQVVLVRLLFVISHSFATSHHPARAKRSISFGPPSAPPDFPTLHSQHIHIHSCMFTNCTVASYMVIVLFPFDTTVQNQDNPPSHLSLFYPQMTELRHYIFLIYSNIHMCT